MGTPPFILSVLLRNRRKEYEAFINEIINNHSYLLHALWLQTIEQRR